MKSFNTIATVFVLIASMSTTSAQFVNGPSWQNSGLIESAQAIYVSYSPTNLVMSYKGDSEITSMKSVAFGWTKDMPVSGVDNLFYEFGVAGQYMWDKDEFRQETDVTSFIGAKVPLSVSYKLPFGTSLVLSPYAGLDPTLFIVGKEVYTYKDEDSPKDSFNLFNPGDDDDDPAYSRFVLNWHVGAKVYVNSKFFVSVAYEGPVTNFYNENEFKINYNMTQVSLGLIF